MPATQLYFPVCRDKKTFASDLPLRTMDRHDPKHGIRLNGPTVA